MPLQLPKLPTITSCLTSTRNLIISTHQFHKPPLIMALLGGILMGLTVAPVNWWFLAYFALIPLIFALSQSFSTATLAGLLWGCGYHGIALFWITGIHPMTWMGVPWLYSLLIALVCWLFITFWGAILVTIWAIIMNYIIKIEYSQHPFSWLTIILGVSTWCVLEKIWSLGPLWWSSLAYTQSPYNLPILQLLTFSGTTTVTAFILLINFLLSLIIKDYLTLNFKPSNVSEKSLNHPSKKHFFLLCFSTVIIFTFPHLVGWLIYQKPLSDNPNKSLKVGIIQGNIPNEIKLSAPGWQQALINYQEGYQFLAKQNVDLIITPETALPFFYDDIEQNTSFYQIVKEQKIPIILGAFKALNKNDYTNSLFSLNSEGKAISRYDKIKLVPLGEYIPFRSILGGIIRRLSPLDTQLIAGDYNQHFTTPHGDAIASICYDSAFSEVLRQQALKGGEFIVTASNNAHYSDRMPFQHHAQDVMRAIETGKWMARATNTGYSAIVNPRGETIWLSHLNEYQTHTETIYRRQQQTFYVLKGDWLNKIFLLIIVTYFFFRITIIKFSHLQSKQKY